MFNVTAYKVGNALEMRPASPKRDWMDISNAKNPYRCLPLNVANSFGWEIINPSKFSVEWNGKSGSKDVTITKESGSIFPDAHFGEGTFTWHTGYLFKTEYPYALYVMGPPNFPKPNVISLNGIVETFWIPFTFTMNWRFTQPGKVDFEPGDVICQVFPVDITTFDNVNPEIRHLSEDPDLEDKYWKWHISRNSFAIQKKNGTAKGDAWQKDYLRGEYADINVTNGCPIHSLRTDEDKEKIPHKSKLIVPEFKVIDGSPYYTPHKYAELLRKVRENDFPDTNKPIEIKPSGDNMLITYPNTNENTLPDIAEKINNTNNLVMLYVTSKNDCNEVNDITTNQETLQNKIRESFVDRIDLHILCVPENEMPFPKIQTDTLYYFAPKNQKPLFYRERHLILQDLDHDIETAFNMASTGASYYDTKFDAKTKEGIFKTESYMKEDTSRFPSAFKMARNLAKEMWKTSKNAAKGLPILVPAEVGISRFSTCEICEHLDQANFRCTQCGCFMKTKTQLASASCPVGKWGEYAG
jgi:hypothetical protein